MEFKPLDWTGWRISENGPSSGDSRRVARTTYVKEKEELISRRLEEEKTLNDCRRHTGFILELLGWAGLSSVPLETVSMLTGASVRRLSSHSEGGELLYKAGIETVLVRRLGETREGLMERIQADFDRQASVLKNELEFLLEGWDDNQI